MEAGAHRAAAWADDPSPYRDQAKRTNQVGASSDDHQRAVREVVGNLAEAKSNLGRR